jgi:tRNA dimethylallyltransferase
VAVDLHRKVFVLAGPTASGKSRLSLLLASLLNGEIISADSRQIYRHMDIGTAKPSPEERKRVRHYFVDELDPAEHFDAGEFGRKGREIIGQIFGNGKVPIVVGGSGLYLRALVDGFFEGPSADHGVRSGLFHRAKEEGNESLLRELQQVDPESASGMRPSNIRRIVRALEVHLLTGSTMTSLQKSNVPANFVPAIFALRWKRAELYRRIDARVDVMIGEGFLEEVRRLKQLGYDPSLNALQTVGYKEAFKHLAGEIAEDSMIELIKRNSRRYAKRQMTWFRTDKRIAWFDVEEENEFGQIAKAMAEQFVRL